MKVCIDPGHGGEDTGAVGNGYFEKDLTLQVSLELRKILNNNEIETVMTRENDENLQNDDRIDRVLNSGADICLSIHFNASNGLGKGTETIYQINNDNSKMLAENVLNEISSLGLYKRRAYSRASNVNPNLDYYFMLRRTRPINTIIVECLFIDNSEDIKFLEAEGAITKLAEKISKGILDYFESVNKEPSGEHWSKPYFDKLYELGLLEDTHNPDDIPTWAELSTMLVRTIEYVEKQKN